MSDPIQDAHDAWCRARGTDQASEEAARKAYLDAVAAGAATQPGAAPQQVAAAPAQGIPTAMGSVGDLAAKVTEVIQAQAAAASPSPAEPVAEPPADGAPQTN